MALRVLDGHELNCVLTRVGPGIDIDWLLDQPLRAQIQLAHNFGCRVKQYTVNIPGLEDIIHLGADVELSEGELDLVREVRRAYARPEADEILFEMLGVEKVESYDNRVSRARRIGASPTPEFVRDIGYYLTKVDDLNDALVTLLYLARAAGYVGMKVAPRLLLKAVPVVGYISLAKDITDIMSLLNWLRGPRAYGKAAVDTLVKFAPRLAGQKILSAGKLGDLLPSFREAVQVAQTSDTLFGYGLSLGGIIGFVEDAVSGIVRSAIPGGGDVSLNGDMILNDLERAGQYLPEFDPYISQSPARPVFAKPADVFDIAALRVLRAAPDVLRLGSLLSPTELANTLTAVSLATEALRESQILLGMTDRMGAVLDVPLPPSKTSSTVARLLDNEGLFPKDIQAADPISASTGSLSPRLLSALSLSSVQEGLLAALDAHKGTFEAAYAGQLVAEYAPALFSLLDETGVKTVPVVLPPGKVLFTLQHYALFGKLDPDPASIERVYGALAAKYIESGRDQFTYQETVALIDLVGGFKNQP